MTHEFHMILFWIDVVLFAQSLVMQLSDMNLAGISSMFFRKLFISSAFILVFVPCSRAEDHRWVEDNFEDFRDGTFDAAGQNLYVTSEGQIKTIHRFDLNTDGYLDLVFNSSHDFVTGPLATCYAQPTERRAGRSSEIAMNGSRRGATADFNKDGFLDLVLTPNNDWVSARRYAFIYWGGSDGWTDRRATNLITVDPLAVQTGDLDGDGWSDLAVLNSARWAPEDGPEKVLRIYWGSPESFRQEVFTDIVLADASDMLVTNVDDEGLEEIVILQAPVGGGEAELAIYWNDGFKRNALPAPVRIKLRAQDVANLAKGDANGDGRNDLLVIGGNKRLVSIDPTTKEKTFSYSDLVVVLKKDGRQFNQPRRIESPKVSSFAVADLNRDAICDVVLCQADEASNSLQILWGDREGSFHAKPMTTLPIGYASCAAVADFDGDGKPDLAIGVNQTGDTWNAASDIFYGDGTGGFQPADRQIRTARPAAVITVPPDKSGEPHRIVFCNTMGGRIFEDVPAQVYWGDKDGFAANRVTNYRSRSGFSSNAADLNNDGYPELIMMAAVHAAKAESPFLGFNILWGSASGPQEEGRTVLAEYGLTSTNVADLNCDGYLDLVGTCNAEYNGEPERLVIWYGAEKGFAKERRIFFPLEKASWGVTIADFNKDGWLDIISAQNLNNSITLFWGGVDGFSSDRRVSWPSHSASDIRTADLNDDHWLDLIVTNYMVTGTLNHDYGTRLYWGGPNGFSPTNAQRLRGSAAFGPCVADFDQDGFLDINIPNYKWTEIRESIQSFLFWGSKKGFSDTDRTSLLIDSSSGSQAGDFNGDGKMDLALLAHTVDGSHQTLSRVYYNDGQRFASPQVQYLPTIGPHYIYRAEIGHIYDRKLRQSYESSIHHWEQPQSLGQITVDANIPGKSQLEIATRSASTESLLQEKDWLPVVENRFELSPDDRYVQYRLTFISDNGDRYPVVDRVELKFIQ